MIRTHGEPESTFNLAKSLGLNIIDCTCPFVRDIQQIVKKHYLNGYKIAVIGNANHPEVKGMHEGNLPAHRKGHERGGPHLQGLPVLWPDDYA